MARSVRTSRRDVMQIITDQARYFADRVPHEIGGWKALRGRARLTFIMLAVAGSYPYHRSPTGMTMIRTLIDNIDDEPDGEKFLKYMRNRINEKLDRRP